MQGSLIVALLCVGYKGETISGAVICQSLTRGEETTVWNTSIRFLEHHLAGTSLG